MESDRGSYPDHPLCVVLDLTSAEPQTLARRTAQIAASRGVAGRHEVEALALELCAALATARSRSVADDPELPVRYMRATGSLLSHSCPDGDRADLLRDSAEALGDALVERLSTLEPTHGEGAHACVAHIRQLLAHTLEGL